ncbi:MAG: DUF1553 domain-containing protein, partial [Verrucomicrobiota bacterium]
VATQSLMLMNSQFLLDQAALFASRLEKEAGTDPVARIRRGWFLALQRLPSPAEQAAALAFLQEQVAHLASLPAPAAEDKSGKESPAKDVPRPTPEQQALINLGHVLLSSNEFLYVD